jgi:hypothetical protein
MKAIVIAALYLAAGTVSAAGFKVISGGAIEPGLEAFSRLVKRETGHELKILYNTAPQIARWLSVGEVFGILIAPPGTIETALKEGTVVPGLGLIPRLSDSMIFLRKCREIGNRMEEEVRFRLLNFDGVAIAFFKVCFRQFRRIFPDGPRIVSKYSGVSYPDY